MNYNWAKKRKISHGERPKGANVNCLSNSYVLLLASLEGLLSKTLTRSSSPVRVTCASATELQPPPCEIANLPKATGRAFLQLAPTDTMQYHRDLWRVPHTSLRTPSSIRGPNSLPFFGRGVCALDVTTSLHSIVTSMYDILAMQKLCTGYPKSSYRFVF